MADQNNEHTRAKYMAKQKKQNDTGIWEVKNVINLLNVVISFGNVRNVKLSSLSVIDKLNINMIIKYQHLLFYIHTTYRIYRWFINGILTYLLYLGRWLKKGQYHLLRWRMKNFKEKKWIKTNKFVLLCLAEKNV